MIMQIDADRLLQELSLTIKDEREKILNDGYCLEDKGTMDAYIMGIKRAVRAIKELAREQYEH